jgi:hypothetical protein
MTLHAAFVLKCSDEIAVAEAERALRNVPGAAIIFVTRERSEKLYILREGQLKGGRP